ncbi:hypothetical protein [Bacillus sp. BP-3]|uniref:hypothetical protein n=1 Tax=Bacillus sp. BP-3 TaxID=3022773 RepID=UPI00232E528E|nr:hypothetical protein [Bacillus sp. BP-3]MDC2863672.1 hypothetical protein [Bacillus sp. BP-3]
MKQTNINVKLSLIQLFLLILNLFIFSSRMRSLPWFVEDSFGLFGIFITAPLLLIIGTIMIYLGKRQNYCIERTRQAIPFIAAIFSFFIVIIQFTDLVNIVALVFTSVMVLITLIFSLQDFSKQKRNYI